MRRGDQLSRAGGGARESTPREDEGYCGKYSIREIRGLCKFYLALTNFMSERGYNYPEYKISLHECRGNEDYKITTEDFKRFDFNQETEIILEDGIGDKPKGLWFSDFYEGEEERVTPSWTGWCIKHKPDWIDPRKCKYILVGKFREDTTLLIDKSNFQRILVPNIMETGRYLVNWKKLKRRYPGGIRLPDIENLEEFSVYFNMWDVSSYVAWNHSGLEDLKVFAISEFQELIDKYLVNDDRSHVSTPIKRLPRPLTPPPPPKPTGPNFSSRRIEGRNFSGNMEYADFSNSTLNNVTFEDDSYLQNSDFTNCTITNTKFKDSDLENCDFTNSVFENVTFENVRSSNVNFTNTVFENVTFENVRSSNVNFTNTVFKNIKYGGWGALFEKSNFTDANLVEANSEWVFFSGGNFTNAKLHETDRKYVNEFDKNPYIGKETITYY